MFYGCCSMLFNNKVRIELSGRSGLDKHFILHWQLNIEEKEYGHEWVIAFQLLNTWLLFRFVSECGCIAVSWRFWVLKISVYQRTNYVWFITIWFQHADLNKTRTSFWHNMLLMCERGTIFLNYLNKYLY